MSTQLSYPQNDKIVTRAGRLQLISSLRRQQPITVKESEGLQFRYPEFDIAEIESNVIMAKKKDNVLRIEEHIVHFKDAVYPDLKTQQSDKAATTSGAASASLESTTHVDIGSSCENEKSAGAPFVNDQKNAGTVQEKVQQGLHLYIIKGCGKPTDGVVMDHETLETTLADHVSGNQEVNLSANANNSATTPGVYAFIPRAVTVEYDGLNPKTLNELDKTMSFEHAQAKEVAGSKIDAVAKKAEDAANKLSKKTPEISTQKVVAAAKKLVAEGKTKSQTKGKVNKTKTEKPMKKVKTKKNRDQDAIVVYKPKIPKGLKKMSDIIKVLGEEKRKDLIAMGIPCTEVLDETRSTRSSTKAAKTAAAAVIGAIPNVATAADTTQVAEQELHQMDIVSHRMEGFCQIDVDSNRMDVDKEPITDHALSPPIEESASPAAHSKESRKRSAEATPVTEKRPRRSRSSKATQQITTRTEFDGPQSALATPSPSPPPTCRPIATPKPMRRRHCKAPSGTPCLDIGCRDGFFCLHRVLDMSHTFGGSLHHQEKGGTRHFDSQMKVMARRMKEDVGLWWKESVESLTMFLKEVWKGGEGVEEGVLFHVDRTGELVEALRGKVSEGEWVLIG
ncbi:hypothetical protein BC829DRAFT_445617 [Chytridium lagenaria]|nr:hypothetical protein BC829DRAFT_445617 [Chytridium lagenaria]